MLYAPHVYAGEPLVGPLTARRTEAGGVIVGGAIKKLPLGTKVWVQLGAREGKMSRHGTAKTATSEVLLDGNGEFQSEPFTNEGAVLPPGQYTVNVLSHFNSGWQSCSVLRQLEVKTDDKCRTDMQTHPALPETPDLVPDDPEFPKAGRHLEARRAVIVPAVPADVLAIEAVKTARLSVPGESRSANAIGKVVEYFGKAPGVKPKAWSASRQPNGKWIVTLAVDNGGEHQQAQWEFDPKNRTVKYLDPLVEASELAAQRLEVDNVPSPAPGS
jgi:hypothetical protein